MNLYEFQAKELLERFGVRSPRGRVAGSRAEAGRAARRLGGGRLVVKAQIHAGERGSHGGVRFADTAEAAAEVAGRMIGRPLVTRQTRAQGQMVRLVYIEDAVEAARQIYVAVTVDAMAGRLVVLISPEGGNAVEQRAAVDPASLSRLEITLGAAVDPARLAAAAAGIGLPGAAAAAVGHLLAHLIEASVRLDATLIEINPLAVLKDGSLLALDAKMTIDDNALFRHPDLARLRDIEADESGDPIALAAQQHHINYLRLDGDIGVVVNGAGLALATLDTLADCGGRAANFMDIRTTASSQDIAYGFRLIVANPETRAVLVNVHGGGMQRCDTIAEGIAIALSGSNRQLPLVVRLAGNNADFARTRLAGAGIAFEEAGDMREAAERAIQLCGREAG
jgi:succinyl-CoA synthetase beta subunit